MPAPDDSTTAFSSTVIYNLGGGDAGSAPRWNPHTFIPTLASFAPVRALAGSGGPTGRRGWQIELWLYDDSAAGHLEACQGRWRPAVGSLAFAPGLVPSEAASRRLQRVCASARAGSSDAFQGRHAQTDNPDLGDLERRPAYPAAHVR